MRWDVFVSHASEDKDFVRELVSGLERAGLSVWFDEMMLQAGDSLRRSIDRGLSESEYGVVVLSNNFFAKEWPKKELDGLVAREDGKEKVILPVWHNVSLYDVREFSPMLADKVSIPSYLPLDKVVEKILRAIYRHQIESKGWQPPLRHLPDGTELVLLPIRPNSDVAVGLAKHPVTNSQYQRFLSDTGYAAPVGKTFHDGSWLGPFSPLDHQDFNHPQKPVVCVDFKDALTYCQWLNSFRETEHQGREWGNWAFLPPQELWDFAAWGDISWSQRTAEVISREQLNIHHNSSAPVAVDESGLRINARGVSDMFGNVWEWCNFYLEPPVSLGNLGWRAEVELRGGGFLDDLTRIRTYIRASMLPDGLHTKHTDLGFRIAAFIPLTYLPNDVRIKLETQSYVSGEFWAHCIRALHFQHEERKYSPTLDPDFWNSTE
jgi:hypothetical protein